MQLERIKDSNCADFKAVHDIYKDSFPIFEQRTLSDYIEALGDDDFYCHAVKQDNKVLGLMNTWRTNKFIYVEHFAILQSERGKNVGSMLLKQLREQSPLPIILDIDPPVDDISIRRRGFYEKLGFVMGDFKHIHPPLTSATGEFELKIMSMPSIDNALFNAFRTYFLQRIMYYSFSRGLVK